MGWLVTIGIVIAIFFSLFIFMMLGMAVSERAAGIFLFGEIALVLVAVLAVRWWRRSQK